MGPEEFPALVGAEVQAAGLAEGLSAGFSPAHAAAFETLADDTFAGGLDDSGADLPAVFHVFRIVRPVRVIAEVTGQLAMGFDDGGAAGREIEGLEIAQEGGATALFEGGQPGRELSEANGVVLAKDLAEFDEMIVGVMEVEVGNHKKAATNSHSHDPIARTQIPDDSRPTPTHHITGPTPQSPTRSERSRTVPRSP
jgi:hypothetical protein